MRPPAGASGAIRYRTRPSWRRCAARSRVRQRTNLRVPPRTAGAKKVRMPEVAWRRETTLNGCLALVQSKVCGCAHGDATSGDALRSYLRRSFALCTATAIERRAEALRTSAKLGRCARVLRPVRTVNTRLEPARADLSRRRDRAASARRREIAGRFGRPCEPRFENRSKRTRCGLLGKPNASSRGSRPEMALHPRPSRFEDPP